MIPDLSWKTFALGGAGMGFASTLFATVRGWLNRSLTWLRGRFVASITVTTGGGGLEEFLKWFAIQPYGTTCRTLEYLKKGEIASLVPGDGLHPIWIKGQRFLVNIASSEKENTYGNKNKTMTITYIGRNSRSALEDLVKSVEEMNKKPPEIRFVYESRGSHWENVGEIVPRTLKGSVFPPGFVERIRGDLQAFYKSKDAYLERGLPWRRGYLFWGLPGTGKSSLIEALAGEFRKNIYLLAAGAMDIRSLISEVDAQDSIIVMEDIDADTGNRATERTSIEVGEPDSPVALALKSDRRANLSVLLNSLDGIGAPEGRVIFVTTNFRERLDPALTRPGRIDFEVEFPLLTRETAAGLYKILGDLSDVPEEEFLGWAPGHTPADARGYLLKKDLLLKVKGNGVDHSSPITRREGVGAHTTQA